MKNYIITGANSYLGREIAYLLAKSDDHRLLLVTRKPFNFEEIQSENILHLTGIDLLEEEHLRLLADQADAFFEGPVHVINCVGYYQAQSPFENVPIDEADRIFDSNFKTVYNTAAYLIPVMVKKGGGHFIGFSCNSVRFNYPQMAPFTSAKAALEALLKCLANEYFGHGISANALQLATLLTEKELLVKPYGDHKNWLKPLEVAQYVKLFVEQPVRLNSGNVISLYHYSGSFFSQSYFDRIKK